MEVSTAGYLPGMLGKVRIHYIYMPHIVAEKEDQEAFAGGTEVSACYCSY